MSKTLLLADDSVTIQKVVGISFASEDVNLLTVDNGDDAITTAREARPDLVLADVVMPGKNGYEVCAALKADPALRHIPVILLTGTFEAFDEDRAREVGAAAHVAKPFEAQTLIDEVKRLLSAAPAGAAPAPPQATPDPIPAVEQAVLPPPIPAPDAALADSSSRPPDDSFDFFDDELGDLAASERGGGRAGAPPDSLDLDRDAVFGFEEGRLAASDPEPAAARGDARPLAGPPPLTSLSPGATAGDRTVAILPEQEDRPEGPAELLVSPPSETGIGESDLTLLEAEPEPPLSAEPRGPSAPGEPLPAKPASLGLDFELDVGSGQPDSIVDAADIAREALVDPSGVSGFDISTSDLGDAPADGADHVPPTAGIEPLPPERRADAALADTRPRIAEPLPHLQAEPIADAEALAEPIAVAQPVDEASAEDAAWALDEIAPQLRAQLHDTLEKIAWESFSDVTERIVRQAVERVEQIAWEVIPHMAETLVREEIRRMKGEK